MDGANGPGHSSMLRLEGIIVYGLGLGFISLRFNTLFEISTLHI